MEDWNVGLPWCYLVLFALSATIAWIIVKS